MGSDVKRRDIEQSGANQQSSGWVKLHRDTVFTMVKQVGPSAWAVYSAVLARADRDTGICYPSLNRIAVDTGLARSTVQQAIKTLERHGLLESYQQKRPGTNANAPTRYVVKAVPTNGSEMYRSSSQGVPESSTRVYRSSVPNKNKGDNNRITRITSDTARAASDSDTSHECALSGSSRPRPAYAPEHEDLARLLDRLIQQNSEAEKPATERQIAKWANTARLMVEQDGREPDDIRSIIEWAQTDDFWTLNIRSMDKLRKQYGRLWDEMQQSRCQRGPLNRSRPDAGGRGTDYYARAIEAKMAAQSQQGVT